MPIDYKKYPTNWLTEIRPRIMLRANNTCEAQGCDFRHGEVVWAVKYKGRTAESKHIFCSQCNKPVAIRAV